MRQASRVGSAISEPGSMLVLAASFRLLAVLSPICIGSTERGAPRKAARRESDNTRYLPSLTEDMEYMTTKKASSRVTRSP